MSDWREHDGGPQPVGDDVWICIDAMPEEMEEVGAGYVRLPKQVGSWKHVTGFFVINQHLIDAKQVEIDALQNEVMWLHNALEQTEEAVVYGYTLLDDIDAKIDAARLEGIRLGLEAAEQAALKAEDTLDNEWRAGGRYDSYLEGRSDGMGDAADLIRNLNPDTIARDVQTISHQSKCDNLHIAREAQDMASEKETT